VSSPARAGTVNKDTVNNDMALTMSDAPEKTLRFFIFRLLATEFSVSIHRRAGFRHEKRSRIGIIQLSWW
jgi:hypothetical protein